MTDTRAGSAEAESGNRLVTEAIAGIDAAEVDTRRAAILGLALGTSFTICAITGLFSWAASDSASWWPTAPAGLYRITQGTHLISGVISVPLLLGKLRTVSPKLVERPLFRSVAHAVERISILVLVAGSIFLLFSGVTNVEYWYPQEFFGMDIGYFFPAAHGKMAIVVMGALVAHILAKLSLTREALRHETVEAEPDALTADRRQFIGGVAATAGLVGVTIAGATVLPLRALGLLSARDPIDGPQGVPINRTAEQANVTDAAQSTDYRLTVENGDGELAAFTLDDLRSMDLHEHELPIACVEGWSRSARWRGVRMRDLLAASGVDEARDVEVVSMTEGLRYGTSQVPADAVARDDTLLALELNGEELHIDHGFPVRLIAANRPGVNQTKWLQKVVVS